VDLASCEQPDELVRLAWSSGSDRRSVIREGTAAARLLLAGQRDELATLFWPVPRRLEAVRRWSGDPRVGVAEGLRPQASAVVPGCIGGALVAYALDARPWAIVALIVATTALLGVVLKLLIAASLRRQVARLDEAAALAIVLDALRAGMRRNPARIPRACAWIREGLAR
jgi:hypothetical protein